MHVFLVMLNFLRDVFKCHTEFCYVDAVLAGRLLKEAEPIEEKRNAEMGDERIRAAYSEDQNTDGGLDADERKLLSRYGLWLLVELTPAREDVPIVSFHTSNIAEHCMRRHVKKNTKCKCLC